MIQLMKIYAKQLLPHFLVILLLVAGQLATSRMNQLFVNSSIPPTALEVYVEKDTEMTDKLMKKLKEVPEISVKQVKQLDMHDLQTKNIQGILVVPKTFDEKLIADKEEIVEIFVASGIQDTTSIKEAVSTNLIQMRGELLLKDSLEESKIDLTEEEQAGLAEDLQLKVQYVNGENRANLGTKSLSIGIITLFILISLLYGNSFLPSFDTRRLQMYSLRSLLKSQGAVMVDLLLLWGLEIGLFLAGVKVIFDTTLPVGDIELMVAVLVYCMSFSLLLVNLGLRNIVSFLFVPWLILNMTLGGGLWNVPTSFDWLHVILPVAMALNGQLDMILGCGGLFFLVNCCVVWQRKGKKKSSVRTVG